jgi:hypothetical protein
MIGGEVIATARIKLRHLFVRGHEKRGWYDRSSMARKVQGLSIVSSPHIPRNLFLVSHDFTI